MATIAKNRTKYIDELFERAQNVTAHTLDNGFRGVPVSAEVAKADLFGFRFAKLRSYGGKYHVNVHGNCWYEFTTN